MKEKFLKMTGVLFLVAMMAVMLTPVPSRAVTTLTGFTAYTTTPGSSSGTISADNYVTINVNNDNGDIGAFVVNYALNPSGSVTVINATAATTTLGSTTVAVTNNATVGGTLGVTGKATLSGGLQATYLNPTSESFLNVSSNVTNIGYYNDVTGITQGLTADGTTVKVGTMTAGGSDFHGLTVNSGTNTTTLTGGTNSSSLTLTDGSAILAVGTSSPASELSLIRATNDGTNTNVSIGQDGGNRIDVSSSTGTTVTGTLTGHGNVFLNSGTPYAAGTAQFYLVNNLMGQMIYTNSQDDTKMTYIEGTDNHLNTGYFQEYTMFSGLHADQNTLYAGYTTYDNSYNITSYRGMAVDTVNNVTTVTGGSTSSISTLTLGDAGATLLTADGSGVTINNNGTVSMLNSTANGGHGLTIYTDHTVLTGGGSTADSSSLTLADNTATLSVGTASTSEIQVLQATNNGSTTAVTIGGSSNRENDILATAANGVNYITANTTNGSNIIEANTNTITGTTQSIMTGSNAGVNLVHNSASMGVTGGSTFTATNNQLTALTADGSGLTVNNGVAAPGATAVSLLNSTGHGLTVKTDSTVLTGGTSSTSLTLNNWGATFATNGYPARVTGVADGETDYDAVNYRQMQKAYSGIASVSALAAIPSTMPGKKFAIGAGYGYFEHESALAIGVKASLFDSLSVTAGVGFGLGDGPNSTASANAGFSYSF